MVEERQDIIATLVKCAAELRELLQPAGDAGLDRLDQP